MQFITSAERGVPCGRALVRVVLVGDSAGAYLVLLLAAAAAAVRYGRGRARGLRDALLFAFFAAAFVAAFAAAYRDDATAFRSTFRGVGGGVALAALAFARRARPPRARDACDALLLGALYVAARDASRSEALLRAALP